MDAPGFLVVDLTTPAEVPAGTTVPFVLSLTSRASRPLDLYLRGRTLTFDVEVTGPRGQAVWRLLEGEMIPAIVHLRTLAPGERIEVRAAWDQRRTDGRPAGPGAYVARGLLLLEGDPLATAPASFRIVEP